MMPDLVNWFTRYDFGNEAEMPTRKKNLRKTVRLCVVVLAAGVVWSGFGHVSAWGYTPDDPVVVQMENRGIQFFEANIDDAARNDGEVVREYARDGLRFISRKFEGYGMPDDPTNSDVCKAQRAWRKWFKTMKPGYVFIDGDG